jgi:hypothetical protein
MNNQNFKWFWCDWCDVAFVPCPECGKGACNSDSWKEEGNFCPTCLEINKFEDDAEQANTVPQTKEELIPQGLYCYDENGKCPFWWKDIDKPEQENGYCLYMKKGDWDLGGGLLWDQCKECGVNEAWELFDQD